jgi:hypothetical protein
VISHRIRKLGSSNTGNSVEGASIILNAEHALRPFRLKSMECAKRAKALVDYANQFGSARKPAT